MLPVIIPCVNPLFSYGHGSRTCSIYHHHMFRPLLSCMCDQVSRTCSVYHHTLFRPPFELHVRSSFKDVFSISPYPVSRTSSIHHHALLEPPFELHVRLSFKDVFCISPHPVGTTFWVMYQFQKPSASPQAPSWIISTLQFSVA